MGNLRFALACLTVAACTRHAVDTSGPDGAVAEMVTLTETPNAKMAYGSTIACSNSATGATRDNTWYRVYSLADFSIGTTFHVATVSFPVQEASASLPITISVLAYTGALDGTTIDPRQLTPLATATTTPADTTGQLGEIVTVPITADIPPGSAFVVEVSEPDMDGSGFMFIGATHSAELRPGYISSMQCGAPAPETTTDAGGAGHIILEVSGTH